MGWSPSHIALVLVVLLVLFGAKRIPDIMRDLARGYRSFLDALREPTDHHNDSKKRDEDDNK